MLSTLLSCFLCFSVLCSTRRTSEAIRHTVTSTGQSSNVLNISSSLEASGRAIALEHELFTKEEERSPQKAAYTMHVSARTSTTLLQPALSKEIIQRIAVLIHAQAAESGNPYSVEQLVEKIPKVAAIVYYTDADEQVVAVGALEGFVGHDSDYTAECGMLATSPSVRGRGLASKVVMKLSDTGYKKCGLKTFFSVTRITNYFSLKTQFFDKGVKSYFQSMKGISTPVGFGISNERPAKIYAVLMSPAGIFGGIRAALNYLNSTTANRHAGYALDDLEGASDISHTTSQISMKDLRDQFAAFPKEFASTMKKIHTRYPERTEDDVMNTVARWLRIEKKQISGYEAAAALALA